METHGERDGRLEEVLAEYLLAVEAAAAAAGAGAPAAAAAASLPDLEAFIGLHPEMADELRAFFADESGVRRLTAQVRPADDVSWGHITDASAAADGTPPRPFGDYELLEEIGRG